MLTFSSIEAAYSPRFLSVVMLKLYRSQVRSNMPSHPTEPKAYARWLIKRLNEQGKGAHRQIYGLVENADIALLHQVYQRTLEVEAAGGLMTPDGRRRRTIGGVFFFLVREALPSEVVEKIFLKSWDAIHQQRRQLRDQELNWSQRHNMLNHIQQQGTIDNMKVTLTGRPGDAVQSGNTMVMQLTHTLEYKHLKFPIGTPEATFSPVVYTVYLAEKLWKKVEAELANPDNLLTFIGVCQFDAETQTMAVLAEHVQVEKAWQPKDDSTPATKPEKKAKQSVTPSEAVPKAKKPAEPKQAKQSTAPVPSLKVPDSVPADVAAKAQDLHAAIGKFHEKIANLKAANQTAGIKMTERLLENTKQQLEKLLSPYK
jgi:hypothetical protein